MLKDKLRGLQVGSAMWQIVHQLHEHGPQTMIELAEATGLSRDAVRPQLSIQCKNGRIFLVGYRRDDDGGHTYIRRLYGLNPPETKPVKPRRFTSLEAQQRYRAKQKKRVNSVFMLGTPHDQRRLGGYIV